MVFDLALNEDFEVYIDHRGDLGTVDGRRGFEQSLLLHLTERFVEVMNTGTEENVLELARVEAERVADNMDMVDQIEGFEAQMSPQEPSKMLVTIVYKTSGVSELEVEV